DGWTLQGNVFHRGHDRYLPLYEDWMIDHFDHRRQSDGEPESDSQLKLDPAFAPMPRYWVTEEDYACRVQEGFSIYTFGFRNRMRSTDSRSCIGTLIPPYPAGNVLPLLLMQPGDEIVLSALLSSFAVDYIVRQKAGGMNLNFFILRQIPVPPRSLI